MDILMQYLCEHHCPNLQTFRPYFFIIQKIKIMQMVNFANLQIPNL